MTLLQLGGEFYVSESREKMGSSASLMTELHGPFANFSVREVSIEDSRSLMTPEASSPVLSGRSRSSAPNRLPEWCYRAFSLERARANKDHTDWGFVAPVWIAISLACLLIQLLAVMALTSIF